MSVGIRDGHLHFQDLVHGRPGAFEDGFHHAECPSGLHADISGLLMPGGIKSLDTSYKEHMSGADAGSGWGFDQLFFGMPGISRGSIPVVPAQKEFLVHERRTWVHDDELILNVSKSWGNPYKMYLDLERCGWK